MENFTREQPALSIIVPSWFTPQQSGKYGKHETFWFACECLQKLLMRTEVDYELILIDNGSTLKDEDIEEKFLMSVRDYFDTADILIRNQENLGFGPAMNQGFRLARGKYIAALNNDILVWEDWEKKLMELLETNLDPKVGIAMPALMKQTKDAREALAMNEIDLKANYNYNGKQAEFGSLWMIKKELMDEIIERDGDIFDENFKLGFGEDRDLWRRIRQIGYETYRTHKTRVFHQGNVSMGKIPNRKIYTVSNRAYLKNLSEYEKNGKKLDKEEKKKLRAEADKEIEKIE